MRIPKCDTISLKSSISDAAIRKKIKQKKDMELLTTSSSIPISRCLHAGNIGKTTTREELLQEFIRFGEIEDVQIIYQKGIFNYCSFYISLHFYHYTFPSNSQIQ